MISFAITLPQNIYYNIVINNIQTVSFKIPYKLYLDTHNTGSQLPQTLSYDMCLACFLVKWSDYSKQPMLLNTKQYCH